MEIPKEKRMHNVVHFENKHIIFVVEIHFDIFEHFSFCGISAMRARGHRLRFRPYLLRSVVTKGTLRRYGIEYIIASVTLTKT